MELGEAAESVRHDAAGEVSTSDYTVDEWEGLSNTTAIQPEEEQEHVADDARPTMVEESKTLSTHSSPVVLSNESKSLCSASLSANKLMQSMIKLQILPSFFRRHSSSAGRGRRTNNNVRCSSRYIVSTASIKPCSPRQRAVWFPAGRRRSSTSRRPAFESKGGERQVPMPPIELCRLAYYGLNEELELALQQIRDGVDVRDRLERSALHHACYTGNVRACRALLAAGASGCAMDQNGSTPMHYAASKTRSQLACSVVVEHVPRESIDAADRNGNTALVSDLFRRQHLSSNAFAFCLA